MDARSRQEFLDGFKSGGKYEGAVAIYRTNESKSQINIFDEELINALPESIAWIAHNGAGYDQINVNACKAKGTPTRFPPQLPLAQMLT